MEKRSRGRPLKNPQKLHNPIPEMEIASNTEAMPITPEVSPILPIEAEKSIPVYRLGCPRCYEFNLVTEQKYYGKRLCRCRECGWRGEMV